MLKLIDRYIAKHILIAVGLVTLVIIGIELILTSFEVFDFGNTNAGFWGPFQLVVLRSIPYRIYDYFPTLVFLGTLLGIGQLAAHNEFIAMQVAGISTHQILFAALKAAALLIIFIFIWGEVIAPKAERYALDKELSQNKITQTLQTPTGFWLRDKDSFIHIQNFSGQELFGISEFVLDQHFRLNAINTIQRALHQDNRWELQNTVSTHFEKDGSATQSRQARSIRTHWMNPSILKILIHEPKTMTLSELWRYTQYLKTNHLNAALFLQVFWQKLFSPFAIAVMIFLAIPILLGPGKQNSLGVRLFVGVSVGFMYLMLYQAFATATQIYRFPPYLSVLVPNLLFFGVGVFLTQKGRL